MKINKLISKGLVLGFLLNSVSILSYATTEIPDRYQVLEGEYITIDNSTEGVLEEIEVFGNTLQDPNNLENIQSVGDLYVDDNGSPILDNKGREQYKIEIISIGKNLFDAENASINNGWRSKTKLINKNEFEVTPNEGLNEGVSYGEVRVPFKLKKGETYTISAIQTGGASYMYCWDANSYATGAYPVNEPFVAGDILDIKLGLYVKLNEPGTFKIQIEKGKKTSVSPYQSNKIELILPTQLQKIGDIADRLYWDKSKNRYVIEKKIKSVILDGDENWIYSSIYDTDNTAMCYLNIQDREPLHIGINNRFITLDSTSFDNGKEGIYWKKDVNIRISKTKLSSQDIQGFLDWLNKNPLQIIYKLKNSEIIDTKLTSKLKLNTYNEQTHVYANISQDINPVLKITVDRILNLSQQAMKEAESNPTLENISKVRFMVNKMAESVIKDQLQEQINQLFTADMVLEKKNTTANVDLYIKCENMLLMSLDTNSITFDDFSGIEDMVKANAVNITVTSSLPYQLNAYLPTEIQNADKSNTMDKTILNIKENSEVEYKTFVNTVDKIVLKDNCIAGNDIIHGIDIKLKGSVAHEKDVYKTTIKFEVQQK